MRRMRKFAESFEDLIPLLRRLRVLILRKRTGSTSLIDAPRDTLNLQIRAEESEANAALQYWKEPAALQLWDAPLSHESP